MWGDVRCKQIAALVQQLDKLHHGIFLLHVTQGGPFFSTHKAKLEISFIIIAAGQIGYRHQVVFEFLLLYTKTKHKINKHIRGNLISMAFSTRSVKIQQSRSTDRLTDKRSNQINCKLHYKSISMCAFNLQQHMCFTGKLSEWLSTENFCLQWRYFSVELFSSHLLKNVIYKFKTFQK